MLIIMFIIGLLWITFGLIGGADGLAAKLLFNVLPFLSGCFVAIYAMGQLGWVTLG